MKNIKDLKLKHRKYVNYLKYYSSSIFVVFVNQTERDFFLLIKFKVSL